MLNSLQRLPKSTDASTPRARGARRAGASMPCTTQKNLYILLVCPLVPAPGAVGGASGTCSITRAGRPAHAARGRTRSRRRRTPLLRTLLREGVGDPAFGASPEKQRLNRYASSSAYCPNHFACSEFSHSISLAWRFAPADRAMSVLYSSFESGSTSADRTCFDMCNLRLACEK